jgi:hypothetical protein
MTFASAVAESLIAPKIAAPGLLAKRAAAVPIRLITAYAPAVKWKLTELLIKLPAIMPAIAAAERQGIALLTQLILMEFVAIDKSAIVILTILLAMLIQLVAARMNIAILIVYVNRLRLAIVIPPLPPANRIIIYARAEIPAKNAIPPLAFVSQNIALIIRLNVPNRLIAPRENIAILLLVYVKQKAGVRARPVFYKQNLLALKGNKLVWLIILV